MIPQLALAFILLAVLNYAISRSALYPPVVFCSVWAVQMLGLWMAGDYFYAISGRTLLIFLCGAVAFSVGGLLSLPIKIAPYRDIDRKSLAYIDATLKAAFLTGVLLLPLFWRWLTGLMGGATVINFYKELRLASMERFGADSPDINLMPLVVPLLTILATISAYEYGRSGAGRLRTWVGLPVALIYQLGSTARSQVLIFLVCLFTATWFQSPKRALRWGAIGIAAFMVLFVVNATQVEKAGARSDSSLTENLPQLTEGFIVYALGSMVAFDDTVRNPGATADTYPFYAYFSRALNKFGLQLEHSNPFYADIAVNADISINTYTTYFSTYLAYGLPFTLGYMAVIGFIASFVFRKACTNDPVYILLLGAALYCTLMTFFQAFNLEIGFCLKTFAVGIIFYRVIPAIARYKQRSAIAQPLFA